MEKQDTSTSKKLQIKPHNNNLLTVDMLMDGYKKYGVGWLQQTMDGLLAARDSRQFMNSLTEEQAKEYAHKQRERLMNT
ncbi:hypothetical protein JMN10_10360 [Capnocytophaga genosp. AHN8471]|uniref:Uncharacterized protein n=1 Tax=Capnocytophaga genosp. AHN8471 TaxID=327574 RepID=A0ABS1YYD3_9FLAO|nr:hypothetical protein [Capnocytophaga genosp. AHN8471]MBM0651403.1 hypothetical protein [Capnocytophaga genosp. AHN8471]MBM0660314.1 hypothetical protein [Capnocytophaga genosp. AHN8471]MBM0662574.1 hypothetical protein [Capnocytophaga genosp. AHN8471]